MTDEQINKAIAAHLGITRGVPDFTGDLNEMHDAEKSLKGYEQIHTYVWNINNRKDWETDFKLMEVHISARDRAEAFLRTLGKWEEATTEESSLDQKEVEG